MLPLADVLVHVYVLVDVTILQRGSRIRATAPRMRRPLSCRAAAVPGHRNGRTSVEVRRDREYGGGSVARDEIRATATGSMARAWPRGTAVPLSLLMEPHSEWPPPPRP